MMAGYGEQAAVALSELLAQARLAPGEIVVVGGSTSEVQGKHIGSASLLEIGEEIASGLMAAAAAAGAELAVQCCEHLNRAIVLRRAVCRRERQQEVTAMPVPGAGGALAGAYYHLLGDEACLVETIQAAAGLDIGDTLIGMHIRRVAVPVRLGVPAIGMAHLTAARSRPPLIGGARAKYPDAKR